MKLYCYGTPPIDYWFGALTRKQLIVTALEEHNENWANLVEMCQQLENLEAEANVAFKSIGWEGDVREGPYYFALPGETDMSIGYIIKQDNNGECFIASPNALSYLENIAFEKTVTS